MKKECKIILLPTKEESNIHLEQDGVIEYYKNSLPNIKADPQHLYILSDDEIKEGDWVIWFGRNNKPFLKQVTRKRDLDTVELLCSGGYDTWIMPKYLKKIIATTDISLSQSQYTKEELDGHDPSKLGLPSISQSDIEYIVNLYNTNKEKKNLETIVTAYQTGNVNDKEVDVEKLALKLIPNTNVSNGRYPRRKFVQGYNQCLQDNADKKFTLKDIISVIQKSIYLKGGFDKEGFSFYKDNNEIMDECIQSLTKEQPKNNTVMVKYESEGLPSKQIKIGNVDLTEFNDNPYKPKLKDNCIIIQKSC